MSSVARALEQPDGSTKEKKELIWGYGSGVAAATTPDYGDVVLAEYTQPFNEGDVTYFQPLYQRAVTALQAFPTHITADAADRPLGTSIKKVLFMEGLPLFQRINMVIPRFSAILMESHCVLKAYACILVTTLLIPTAIVLSSTVAHSTFRHRLKRPVVITNSF